MLGFNRKKDKYKELQKYLGDDESSTDSTLYGYNYKSKQNRGKERSAARSKTTWKKQVDLEEESAVNFCKNNQVENKKDRKLGEKISDESIDKKWWKLFG